MSKTKDEIIANCYNILKEHVTSFVNDYDIIKNIMTEYSDQQNASLLAEVELLKTLLKQMYITYVVDDQDTNKEGMWLEYCKRNGIASTKKSDAKSPVVDDAGIFSGKEEKQAICKHPNIQTDGGGDYCPLCHKRWNR